MRVGDLLGSSPRALGVGGAWRSRAGSLPSPGPPALGSCGWAVCGLSVTSPPGNSRIQKLDSAGEVLAVRGTPGPWMRGLLPSCVTVLNLPLLSHIRTQSLGLGSTEMAQNDFIWKSLTSLRLQRPYVQMRPHSQALGAWPWAHLPGDTRHPLQQVNLGTAHSSGHRSACAGEPVLGTGASFLF